MIKIANNLVVFANTKSAGGLGTAKVAPRATRGTASAVASRTGVASGAPRGMVPAVPLVRPINAPVAPIGTASTTPVATPINAPVAPAVRASSPSLVEQAFTALGGKALQKGWNAAQSAFKTGPRSFGTSVPAGAGMAERTAAQQQGNALLAKIQADKEFGARITGARIKTPDSIAGHGSTASAATMDDLAGMRVSMPGGDYSQNAIQRFMDRMKGLGVTFADNASKTLIKPGYHGVNIKGRMQGTNGEMSGAPIEFQLTPRRMIGTNQVDHSTSYKPQESGVNSLVARYGYRPAIGYYSNTVSPFVPASTRAAHTAGVVIPTAAAGYALANAGGAPQIPAEGGYVAAPPDTSPTPQSTVGTQASIAPLAPGPSS